MGYLDLLIWFPTIVSIVLWIQARALGVLSSRELIAVGATFLAAFGMQVRGGFRAAMAGFLVQVGVAIFLSLKLRLES